MPPVATESKPASPAPTAQKAGEVTSQPSSSLSQQAGYTLDYSLWAGSSATPATKEQFVTQLRRCLVGLGFFYLRNSPLDEGRWQRLFDLSKQFFQLPLETRMKIDIEQSRHFRGYSKFADERTQDLADHRDQIDFGPEVEPIEATEEAPYLNLYGCNQFLPSSELPDHREAVLDWFSTCEALSRDLTAAIELGLGAAPGRLAQYLNGTGEGKHGNLPYARMKTIRYPTGKIVDGIERHVGSQQGVGAHKDGGWLTLLATDSTGGLQVQDLSGRWLDVPPCPGQLIVNFGQQIEALSAGVVQAATHRVVSHEGGNDRHSIAWFATPALNAVLHPLQFDELSSEVRAAWTAAETTRNGGTIVSDVPQGDLHAGNEPFGHVAWRGITRSHPSVVRRHHTLKE